MIMAVAAIITAAVTATKIKATRGDVETIFLMGEGIAGTPEPSPAFKSVVSEG
jgi:hypothetical protein